MLIRASLAGRLLAGPPAQFEALAEKIQPLMPGPVDMARLHVRSGVVANSRPSVDRRIRIARAALERLAPMMVGQPVMRNHAAEGSGDLPVARVFEAGTREAEGGGSVDLLSSMYFPRNAAGDHAAEMIDAGIWREYSISAYFNAATCTVCGKDVNKGCEHKWGNEYGGTLALLELSDPPDDGFEELSLVWKGRLAGTHALALRHGAAEVAMVLDESRTCWWR